MTYPRGEIFAANSPVIPNSEARSRVTKSTTGLNKTIAFGLGDTERSSPSEKKSSIVATAAARYPPAEPPEETIRWGSTPSILAFLRTQRMALTASFRQVSGFALSFVLSRYSARTVTMPRSAKYCACLKN